jgi:hypothetical protein
MTSSLMGRVVRFRGGRHREVESLLPWYLGGQLDADEHERVEAHLKVCAECQAEVRFQQQLGDEIAELPIDVERGWAKMQRRIAEDAAPRPSWALAWRPARLAGAAGLALRTSPTWGGWVTASMLLVAAVAWLRPLSPDGAYHALAAKAQPTPADIVVVFRPETPERDLRAALTASGAEIVGGPTEADAYILSAPLPRRAAALAALRQRAEVVMAEPIDRGAQP